jgi:hypothetical protein
MLLARGQGAELSRAMALALIVGGGAIIGAVALFGVYGAAAGASVLYALQALLSARLPIR